MKLLALLAAAATGLLAGASLDQSIKQLPARRRIGAVAYAAYAGAADLGNGIAWYALLGVSAALLCLVAGIYAGTAATGAARWLGWATAGLSLAHSFTTSQAAPRMLASRRHAGDEAALAGILDGFARWQAIRALLQVANFASALALLLSL